MDCLLSILQILKLHSDGDAKDTVCALFLIIWCVTLLVVLLHRRLYSSTASWLPPGPPGWPVFGNMFELGSMPHKTIAELKEKYGPVKLQEVFLEGSETTSSSIEWAMAELLSHPEIMTRAKNELTQVVGKGNRFNESHIENLPFLQAVMKETLRLHQRIPFLVPRRSIEETDFMGYQIPKNTHWP